ncbi:hypothetical protein FHG87_022476, partial [Trinorchestia longiramus]
MISVEERAERGRPKRWRLKSCCLFSSLSTGCVVISIISMCESLIYIIGLARVIRDNTSDTCSDEANETKSNVFSEKTENDVLCEGKPWANHVLIAASFVLFVMIIFFLVSLLMYFGVRRRRYKLLYPWLWWNIGEMIVMFHSFSPKLNHSYSPWRGLVTILIEVYFCFIVYSHIEELKEPRGADDVVDVVSYVTVRNSGLSGLQPRSYVVPGASRGPGGASGSRGPTHVHMSADVMSPQELAAKVDAARLYGDQPPPYSPPGPGNGGASSSVAAPGTAGAPMVAPSTPPPSYSEVAGAPLFMP